jgi:hypothetical protein
VSCVSQMLYKLCECTQRSVLFIIMAHASAWHAIGMP